MVREKEIEGARDRQEGRETNGQTDRETDGTTDRGGHTKKNHNPRLAKAQEYGSSHEKCYNYDALRQRQIFL